MQYWCILIIFILLYNAIEAKKIEIECTSNCECDNFYNLRRANCSNSRMLNIKDNVPRKVEVLLYSHNYVSIINDNEFANSDLSALKFLNLSQNKIQDIKLFAFTNLTKLKSIDLSHNALQFVQKQWFIDLPALEELDLSNNYLNVLEPNKFVSNSLKILILAECSIPFINNETFSHLPQLIELDITKNHIISLQASVISELKHLQEVRLINNQLTCNSAADFVMHCKQNNIYIDYDYCPVVKKPKSEKSDEKFQKMIMYERVTSWIIDEESGEQVDIESELTELHDNYTIHKLPNNKLIDIIELSPILSILIPLSFGFTLGLLVGCSCSCKPQELKRKNVGRCRGTNGHDQVSQLLNLVEDNVESTPMTVRKLPLVQVE